MVVAGLQHYDTWSTVNRQHVRQQLEVNAVGPLFLVQALQHNLAESAKVQWSCACITVRKVMQCTYDTGVCMQVVLLASRMGSLTQVEFTKGDVVSTTIDKCETILLPDILDVSPAMVSAVWLPYGKGSLAYCWCDSG